MHSPVPTLLQVFDKSLARICHSVGTERLGLAISGGVDSMALASLCSRSALKRRSPAAFTAFIVDHGLRQGSTDEAALVAQRVNALGITAQVLKLQWQGKAPQDMQNVESEARRLRFQVLGRACQSHSIRSLLLAHHADDQAETLLFRLIRGYTGSGLQGIKSEADIPACHGLWGIGRSGLPRTVYATNQLRQTFQASKAASFVEDGGVQLARPLLDLRKLDLEEHCRAEAIAWVEDATNKDPTLTPRNAIRSISARLPTALRSPRLQIVQDRVKERKLAHEEVVNQIYDKTQIELDLCSGSVKVRFPDDLMHKLSSGLEDNQLRKSRTTLQIRAAMLLRRLMTLVTPLDVISLQDVESAVVLLFPTLRTEDYKGESGRPRKLAANCANTIFALKEPDTKRGPSPQAKSQPSGGIECSVSRTRPRATDLVDLRQVLWSAVASERDSSPWSLFDGRFWIRARPRSTKEKMPNQVLVRFINEKDLSVVSSKMRVKGQKLFRRLRHLMNNHAPANMRFALPAIFESYTTEGNDGQAEERQILVAFPSLGWSNSDWRATHSLEEEKSDDVSSFWQIRYKKVDIGDNDKNHYFTNTVSGPKPVKSKWN